MTLILGECGTVIRHYGLSDDHQGPDAYMVYDVRTSAEACLQTHSNKAQGKGAVRKLWQWWWWWWGWICLWLKSLARMTAKGSVCWNLEKKYWWNLLQTICNPTILESTLELKSSSRKISLSWAKSLKCHHKIMYWSWVVQMNHNAHQSQCRSVGETMWERF